MVATAIRAATTAPAMAAPNAQVGSAGLDGDRTWTVVGADGQVGRLPGLAGQRLEVRSGQFVERVLAQCGGRELSQARPGLVVAVLVAADHLSRRQRGQ